MRVVHGFKGHWLSVYTMISTLPVLPAGAHTFAPLTQPGDVRLVCNVKQGQAGLSRSGLCGPARVGAIQQAAEYRQLFARHLDADRALRRARLESQALCKIPGAAAHTPSWAGLARSRAGHRAASTKEWTGSSSSGAAIANP
jgi:hypothetical protein